MSHTFFTGAGASGPAQASLDPHTQGADMAGEVWKHPDQQGGSGSRGDGAPRAVVALLRQPADGVTTQGDS